MNINELEDMWERDCIINPEKLDEESLTIPLLHNKYFKIFNLERKNYIESETKLKKFKKIREEYFKGNLSKEILEKLNWSPYQHKVTSRVAIDALVEGDDLYSNKLMKHNLLEQKVDYLAEILKMISHRSFHIKEAIEWKKFTVGEM